MYCNRGCNRNSRPYSANRAIGTRANNLYPLAGTGIPGRAAIARANDFYPLAGMAAGLQENNFFPGAQRNNFYPLAGTAAGLQGNEFFPIEGGGTIMPPFRNNVLLSGQNNRFQWQNPYTDTARVNICGTGMLPDSDKCYLAPNPGVPKEYYNGSSGVTIEPSVQNLNNPNFYYPIY